MSSVLGRLLAALVAGLLLAPLLALSVTPVAARVADPRWEFYTKDTTRYSSPWFAKAHRIMIPFGCTKAPYYSPDKRCTKGRGFHHGIDLESFGPANLSVYQRLLVAPLPPAPVATPSALSTAAPFAVLAERGPGAAEASPPRP